MSDRRNRLMLTHALSTNQRAGVYGSRLKNDLPGNRLPCISLASPRSALTKRIHLLSLLPERVARCRVRGSVHLPTIYPCVSVPLVTSICSLSQVYCIHFLQSTSQTDHLNNGPTTPHITPHPLRTVRGRQSPLAHCQQACARDKDKRTQRNTFAVAMRS